MQDNNERDEPKDKSEFLSALRWGLLLGLGILVIVVPPWRTAQAPRQPAPAVVQAPPATPAPPPVAAVPQPAPVPQEAPQEPAVAQAPAPASPAAPTPPAVAAVKLADFSGEEPSPDARHVANWAVHSKDHKRHGFVIVDKKDARVYVFGPDGKLKESAPALLGSARGDHTVPGVGDKPLSQVKPDEKTTPAGRFVAERGKNTNGEDVVWVDYDAAVSMHRIRPNVAADRRLERLATLSVDDNRISFGCINLPVTFYEEVLSPTVKKHGAIVYVLPETKRTPQQLFGSYDVTPVQAAAAAKRMKRV